MGAERPAWRRILDDPAIRAISLYAALAIVATIAAYTAIFTTFVSYDDEGTLLVSLDAFLRGEPLYADIFSPYGPFYHEFFGALFKVTGMDVTTDASRSLVVVIWVATSFLLGLACQRLTGRLSLGASGMVVAFAVLYALFPEPMHPHGLLVLLLSGFLLLAVYGPGRRVALAGAVAGALLGAALMTKVNLGGYAIAAVVLAAALVARPVEGRPWLRWLAIAAFMAMPLVVMASDLREGWVRSFLLLLGLGSASIVVAAWPARPRAGEEGGDLWRWLLWALAGTVGMSVASLLAIVALGTSPSELWNGMIVDALNIRNVNAGAFPTPDEAIAWGIAAVAAAALSVRLRGIGSGAPSLWTGLLRGAAGLTIWLSIATAAPFGLDPEANQVVLPTVLAWVAAVPPAGAPEPPFKSFLRVLLPASAVGWVLGAYPVPGAQIGVAAMMFVPVGALCLADSLATLRAWSEARGGDALVRFRAAASVGTVALAAMLALTQIVLPGANDAVTYSDREPAPFPGASQLRLDEGQTDEYAGVLEFLAEYECTAFIGYPNVDSLYLWSGIEPPAPAPPGVWVLALADEEQERVLRQLRESPRPCVLYNEGVAEFWLNGREGPDTGLARYILEESETVGESGAFQLRLPSRGP